MVRSDQSQLDVSILGVTRGVFLMILTSQLPPATLGGPQPPFLLPPCIAEVVAVHGRQGRAGPACNPPAAPQGCWVGGISWESAWAGGVSGAALPCTASIAIASHHTALEGAGLCSASTSSPEEEGGQEEEEGASPCRPPLAGTHQSPMRLRPGERPREHPAAGPPRRQAGGAAQKEGEGQSPPTLPLPSSLLHPLFNSLCEQEGVHPPLLSDGGSRGSGDPLPLLAYGPIPPLLAAAARQRLSRGPAPPKLCLRMRGLRR